MKRIFLVSAFLFALSLPSFATTGTTVFDSTAGNVSSSNPVSTGLGGPISLSFTTSGTASTLAVVRLKMALGAPDLRAQARTALTPPSSFSVDLFTNNPAGPQPGTPIANIGSALDSSLTLTPQLLTFTPATTINLTPNTRYWIVVSGTVNSSAFLLFTGSTGSLPPSVTNEFSTSGPVNGSLMSLQNTEIAYLAAVVVNPTTPVVPLPPSVWLSMIGLMLVGAYYGFRQRLA